MATTGYSDTFNRTVANGLGSATSGQTYTLMGVATQFSVAPNTASIAPSSTGDKAGYIDLQTQNLDISAQVALSAIPATNLATVGFFSKLATASNYYNGTMMVAAGGAISLRFSRVIAGALTTISTTATGLTYVANTFYNLRYAIYWSRPLQTNVMSLKLWVVGGTEPGGWMATATDANLTDYTSGTSVGIMGRDESTVLGAVITRHRSVLASSYSLPVPALTDPMCYDPAVAFPKQTTLESLADAADAVMTTLDPLAASALLFPRVRVSATNFVINNSLVFINPAFAATEYNIGTPTNLAQDSGGIYLAPGIWMVTFEMRLGPTSSNELEVSLTGTSIGSARTNMRSNTTQTNDSGVGGTCHISELAISIDPTTPQRIGVTIAPNVFVSTYLATYLALSAIKVSDYFV